MQTDQINWATVPGVEIDPERQSGAPVFAGTRVPVSVVVNNIHDGGTNAEITEILENFDVTREQVNVVLMTLRAHRNLNPLASAGR